jgi:hypothetical protein
MSLLLLSAPPNAALLRHHRMTCCICWRWKFHCRRLLNAAEAETERYCIGTRPRGQVDVLRRCRSCYQRRELQLKLLLPQRNESYAAQAVAELLLKIITVSRAQVACRY